MTAVSVSEPKYPVGETLRKPAVLRMVCSLVTSSPCDPIERFRVKETDDIFDGVTEVTGFVLVEVDTFNELISALVRGPKYPVGEIE